MSTPDLWIIAGPNGAGKTTTVSTSGFQVELQRCIFVNADAVTLRYLNELGYAGWDGVPADVLKTTFIRAAEDSYAETLRLLEAGEAVVVETVLSTRKYCQLVERVKELGGRVHLVYIALDSSERSIQRVKARTEAGGHGVPLEKLPSRWKASLELLPWFAFHSSRFWVLDNSESDESKPPRLLFSGRENEVKLHGNPTQAMRQIVSDFITRLSAMDVGGKWRFDIDEEYHLPL